MATAFVRGQKESSGLFGGTPADSGIDEGLFRSIQADEDTRKKNIAAEAERGDTLKKKGQARSLLAKKKTTQKMRGRKGFDEQGDRMDPNKLESLKPSFTPSPPRRSISVDIVSQKVPKEDIKGLGAKTLDFLFGSEAAVIGIAHDSEGWSWNVENLKQQWSEQPLWLNALSMTSLIGTMILPASLAARSSLKFGSLATKMGRYGDEAVEIANWKSKGMIGDDKIRRFADFGHQSNKTVKTLRRQEVALSRYSAMAERAKKVARGELSWSNPIEKALHSFEKRFSQTYNAAIGDASMGDVKSAFHEAHDKLWQNDTIGTILRDMPSEKDGPGIYGYMLGKLAPGIATKAAKEFGPISAKNKKWADFYFEGAKRRQASMLEDGFITPETYKRIGEAHIPAQMRGTIDPDMSATRTYMVPVRGTKPKKVAAGLVEVEVERTGINRIFGPTKKVFQTEGEYEYVAIKLGLRPRMDSPTLLHRSGTHDDIYDRLVSGKLITDPADMTARGFMTDGLLHTNFKFIRDLAMDDNNIATAAQMAAWAGDTSKAAKAGFMPLSYAGEHATATLTRMIAKASGRPEEALPWIRKELYNEIFGKDGMMSQTTSVAGDIMDVLTTIYKTTKTAGSIPTHLQNLTGNMVFLSQAGFNPVAPENIALMGTLTGTFNKIYDVQRAANKAGLGGRSLFDPASGALKGVNLGTIKSGGRTFNLNEEMFDPAIRELVEESAFQSVEGAGNLPNILSRLRSEQHTTRGMIKVYMKAKNIAQVGDKVPWFDKLTKSYLAEDMVPKIAYYIGLRGQGLSKPAAATEVARRLPMYGTVGSAIKGGRKFAFPWATFPAEAIRITKNNIMDHPIRMLPWLRAPQIMQSMLSGMELSGDREEVEASKRQLPFWAQSGTTVVSSGQTGGIMGAASTGGLLGAATGAVLGKSAGAAYTGAAAGASFSAMLAAMTIDEEHEGQIRGAMMDWLPHSTFMLTTDSVDFGGNILPFKNIRGAITQMPAEPLAILKPLIAVMSGQTEYGQPVGGGTVGGGVAKSIAGMIGFLSPPLLQKYGFKLTTPDVPLWGDPTGVTNISRGLIDTGNAIDPMTGLPGSSLHDAVLNNFGTWKSYVATGEQQLANEALTEKSMSEVRGHLSRNLTYYLENGQEEETVDILSEIMATFSNQYAGDPQRAQTEYTEWLVRHTQQLGRHPKLRNWSQEELVARLRSEGAKHGKERSAAHQNILETLRNELKLRGGGGSGRYNLEARANRANKWAG